MGKLNAALGETGYPAIQLMTLVETGIRALIGAAFGTGADGEITWARRLLHHPFSAEALIKLYHERWEHEITYLALRHALLQGRVLRSGDPAGLQQEMWALLTGAANIITATGCAHGRQVGGPTRHRRSLAHAARP